MDWFSKRLSSWDAFGALSVSTLGRAVLSLENGFQTDRAVVLTEQDILGDRLLRTVAKKKADAFLHELANSMPATSWSTSTTASVATRAWWRWMSAVRRTIACA